MELQDCGLSDKVMSYRGGYTIEERREIESALFKGLLLGKLVGAYCSRCGWNECS